MIESKNSIALYHWWDHPVDAKPYSNLRSPILLSIATLRAVSDIPICILDLSGRPKEDWEHFPEKLGFSIIKANQTMKIYADKVPGWKHLSRIFDIKHWAKNCKLEECENIVYVDSDVFWIKNPFPLSGSSNKMNINRWNTGFFYFNRHNCEEFWDKFESYTIAAIHSEEIRNILKKYVGYDSWYGVWDEMTLTYMVKNHPEVFNFIPVREHATLGTIEKANLNEINMLHANGLMVSNPLCKIPGEREHCRGLLCLTINEFYKNINKVLNESDLNMIFTKKELDTYIPQKISLSNDIDKLLATKESKVNQYHLSGALRPPIMFN